MRRLRVWSLVGLLVLGVASISSSIFAQTVIQYQYNWNASEEYNSGFEAMIEAFNKSETAAQANMVVEGYVISGGYDRLLTAIASGTAADVVNFESAAVTEWAAKGLLEPLDDLYTPESIRNDFFPADAAEVTWNGRVWGLPGYTNVRGLYWNVDIFNEIGLDSTRSPATMREIGELNQKALQQTGAGQITRMGFVPWLGSYGVAGWFFAFGGELYDPETGLPTAERPEHVRAWEWFQEIAQQYPPAQYGFTAQGVSGAHGYFLGGSFAAVTAADNSVWRFQEYGPDVNFLTGAVPVPEGGRNGTWGGGPGHVIPAGAEHPEEARIFLQWVATEGQRILYDELSLFPTNIHEADRVRQALDPNDLRFPLWAQMGERNARFPLWTSMNPALNRAQNSLILNLQGSPGEALAQVQTEVLPLYQQLDLNR